MARSKKRAKEEEPLLEKFGLPAETKRAILAIVFIVLGVFLILAYFGAAGIAGNDAYRLFNYLLGAGYFIVPLLFVVLAAAILRDESSGMTPLKGAASALFLVSGLGFVEAVSGRGGLLGKAIEYPIVKFFDIYAALIVLGALLLISLITLAEGRISMEVFALLGKPFTMLWQHLRGNTPEAAGEDAEELAPTKLREPVISGVRDDEDEDDEPAPRPAAAAIRPAEKPAAPTRSTADALKALLGEYHAPPLSLLERDRGKPGVGDIKANANLIKRTLQNFGIMVELDEISIGPSVTRYAVKPAEGVRLSKIVALQQNLELALAAKGGIRIEAPIPGKSLVGIEVPNIAKTTVGLGALLSSPEFTDSGKPLIAGLGRDIAGSGFFANIAKMPHVLVAGATGSGKSVTIHTLITSLLYRNGPQTMRFIMIDPKRVELTLYNRIPHLLTPVITDPKKAIMALRWAGKEMQRRYDLLEQNRVRDIESYHSNVLRPRLEKLKKGGGSEGEEVPEAMPYIVIIIDELADIMQTFPRELEAAIVRLAQMSRAVGIHLVLSTQRPSVNVITGLIKANVPSRIALQVASQVDSRTIIDGAGAEKLLGQGDMLYLSADMNKPVRRQSAFISEEEVKQVADYIAKHNEAELPMDLTGGGTSPEGVSTSSANLGAAMGGGGGFAGGFDSDEEIDDDMYEAARQAVIEAGKASTSYLQRKLRVGYARAARLMDVLEERGVIGPQDGAKPREILQGRPAGSAGEPDPGDDM